MATSREDAEQDIVSKATSDPAFRKALVSDPRSALEGALGTSLPQGIKVSVLEETADQFYMVLPAAGQGAGTKLSDEALASVAGGQGESWNENTCIGTLRCA